MITSDSVASTPHHVPAMRPSVLVIAMNYAPEVSGTAPYTQQLAEHLTSRYEVQVIAGLPHYPEWKIHDGFGAWRETRVEGRVTVVRLRHFVPRRLSSTKRVLHEVTFAIRALFERGPKPDVIVAVSPPIFGALAAMLIARLISVPFGVIVQDIYSAGLRELTKDTGLSRMPAKLISWLEGRILQRAEGIVTIDPRFAASLEEISPSAMGRTTIIGNWAHIPRTPSSSASFRDELGWNGKHVLLHAGNMGEKQGLESLVEAARDADQRQLPLLYVLMGDGSQRLSLERAAVGVRCLEFRPSVPAEDYTRMLGAADLLLINERPGVAEMSLPSKLTSYCAAARPIVAAVDPHGITAETVRATGAGIIVAPGNPRDLNSEVMRFLNDQNKISESGRRGRAYAVKHYAASGAMEKYCEWISNLMADIGRSRRGKRIPTSRIVYTLMGKES